MTVGGLCRYLVELSTGVSADEASAAQKALEYLKMLKIIH